MGNSMPFFYLTFWKIVNMNIPDKDKEYYHIYNFQQVIYYYALGIKAVDYGVGDKGDIYFLFERNEELYQAYKKWCKK